MTFGVEVEWVATDSPSKDVEAALSQNFRPTDESVCIWADGPVTVRISFETEGATFDAALDLGMAEVNAAAERLSLPGHMWSAVVSDDDGCLGWKRRAD